MAEEKENGNNIPEGDLESEPLDFSFLNEDEDQEFSAQVDDTGAVTDEELVSEETLPGSDEISLNPEDINEMLREHSPLAPEDFSAEGTETTEETEPTDPPTPSSDSPSVEGNPIISDSRKRREKAIRFYSVAFAMVALAVFLCFFWPRSCGKPVEAPEKTNESSVSEIKVLSSEKEMIDFTIPEQADIKIDGNNIIVEMKFGTDLTNLTPSFGISEKATVYPASGVEQNFSDSANNPIVYTVTAEDSSTKDFRVTVKAEKMDPALLTIHAGNGPEHPLLRQAITYPVYFGFTGDLNDSVAVKKWAGGFVHRLAIKCGYVDFQTGKEIRVYLQPGGLYEIVKDENGNFFVAEYASANDYQSGNTSDKNPAANTFAEAKFAGTERKHLNSYEYIFNPLTQEKESLSFEGNQENIGVVNFENGAGSFITTISSKTESASSNSICQPTVIFSKVILG